MTRKVLVLCEPGKDGAFSYVRSVIEGFHKHYPEIQVDYYYSSKRGGPGLVELVEAVRARGGEAWDMKIGSFPAPGDLRVILKVVLAFLSGRYSVVHANCSKAGAIARMVNLLFRRKFVFYSPHAFYGMAGKGGMVEGGFNLVERLLRSAGRTIFSSDDEQKFAIATLGYGQGEGVLVYNGIDTEVYSLQTPEAKREARQRLGIPLEARVLLTIGRESYQKNLAALYGEFEALGAVCPDLFFIHLGKGGEELALTLSAPARARLHLREFTNDLRSYLMAADGFIMVSRYEGLSLSMLLALSTGIPMILTKAPGMNLLRGFGYDGISWVEHPDSPDHRGSLNTSIMDWWRAMPEPSQKQRDLTRELFDETNQFRKLVAIYGLGG